MRCLGKVITRQTEQSNTRSPPDMRDRKQKPDDQHIDGVGGFRATVHNIGEISDRQGAKQDLLRRAGEKELKETSSYLRQRKPVSDFR